MASLDKDRKQIADRIKKFEKTTEKVHAMADRLHQKMEKLHLETIATRGRALGARKRTEARSADAGTAVRRRDRKVS